MTPFDGEDQVTGCPTGENLTDRPSDAEDQVTGCPTGENLTDRPSDAEDQVTGCPTGENLTDRPFDATRRYQYRWQANQRQAKNHLRANYWQHRGYVYFDPRNH